MKNNTIEDIKEYAKDSQTSEEPTEQNYAEGVKVGWTLPAKWWNWLMNAFTKRFRETKATVDSMYEELSNLMWPLVPGENETNDQCSHRIYGRLSELSEQIGTNTENIAKNATAINTEKLARQNAIEQEQTSRTSQDNVLDSKISSLYTLITQTQTEIYNSIITHNIYRTDEIDWTTLFNDLKNKGCPTGLHRGDIVYTVNSYDGHYCAFLVVDINYFKGLVSTFVRLTSSQGYTKPLDYNHIVLLSLGNKLTAYASSDVERYTDSTVYKNLNGPFCTAIRSEILSSYSDTIYNARITSNGTLGYLSSLPGNSCNVSLCQLVGPEVQLMIPSNGSFSPADSKRIHYNDFQRQFKFFKEKGFAEYGYRIFDVPVNLGATPQRLTSANIGVLDIASNTDVFAIRIDGDNNNIPSGGKPALSTFIKTIPKKGAEGTTSYFPEFFIVGDNS